MLTMTQVKIINEFNDDISIMVDEIEGLRNEIDGYVEKIGKLKDEINNHECETPIHDPIT